MKAEDITNLRKLYKDLSDNSLIGILLEDRSEYDPVVNELLLTEARERNIDVEKLIAERDDAIKESQFKVDYYDKNVEFVSFLKVKKESDEAFLSFLLENEEIKYYFNIVGELFIDKSRAEEAKELLKEFKGKI